MSTTIEMSDYTVGADAYREIPAICAAQHMDKVVLIGGKRALGAAEPLIRAALEGSVQILGSFVYGTECTQANADRLLAEPAVQQADVVFAVGGGNTAAEEALFLSGLCSKVTMLVRRDRMRAQAALVRELEEAANVEIRYRTSLAAIGGGDMPSWVTLRDNDTGAETREELDEGSFGVFVFVGHEPASSLVEGLADLSPEGGVVTDERMATRTPGLFCAGDVREKPLRQIVTACADGAVAATSAAQFLRGV